MPKGKGPDGFSKKAVKQMNENRNKPISKRYGKPVMKEDTREEGRRIGYATVGPTQLPPYKPRKRTNKQSRRNLRSVRGK